MTAATVEPAEIQAPTDERLTYRGPIQRLLTRPEIGALIGTAAIWIFFWAVGGVFGTTAGANNFLDVSTSLAIPAIAVAMLMIGGEFDLSAGAMTGATGMLVVLLVKEPGEFGGAGLPLWIAIPITFVFALGVGWANGTLVERTRLPSFIVTLGTFFVLRGAKLGFAKLFTDKVIVEGLDDAPDFDFWANIFGGVWIRNNHVWESFLGGRNMVFAVLAVSGAVALAFGLLELSLRQAETKDTGGLIIGVAGLASALVGLISLASTDTTAANWTWGIVMGLGVMAAFYGIARWRYEPNPSAGQAVTMSPDAWRGIGIGLALIVAGALAGVLLDSTSQTELGFLLTVQGLRAMLFAGLVILGVISLLLAARRVKGFPFTQFAVIALTAISIGGVGFVIQSEAASRKFRAELFAWLLMSALLILVVGVLRWRFAARQSANAAADRRGRTSSGVGITLIVITIALRLLWSTTAENEASAAVITYRISVLLFLVFAAIATWVLLRTKFGSWTFAVGGNADAARQVGVPAARTKTRLFMLVSSASWLVGMLIAFRLNSVQANVGDGQEFLYIIAAVVGGNLLTGGYGSAAGAAIGALIMAMSFQGIPFAGWNSDWRWLFVGVILLLAVLVNNFVRSKAEAAS